MKKRIRVAQIISEAADFHLCSAYQQPVLHETNTYSCIAVHTSAYKYGIHKSNDDVFDKLLKNLGLPSSDPSGCFHHNFGLKSKQNQNDRYMWLKMAAEYCRLHDVRVTINA